MSAHNKTDTFWSIVLLTKCSRDDQGTTGSSARHSVEHGDETSPGTLTDGGTSVKSEPIDDETSPGTLTDDGTSIKSEPIYG